MERKALLDELAGLDDRERFVLLRTYAQSENPEVRATVARVGFFDLERSTKEALLSDPDARVRAAAVTHVEHPDIHAEDDIEVFEAATRPEVEHPERFLERTLRAAADESDPLHPHVNQMFTATASLRLAAYGTGPLDSPFLDDVLEAWEGWVAVSQKPRSSTAIALYTHPNAAPAVVLAAQAHLSDDLLGSNSIRSKAAVTSFARTAKLTSNPDELDRLSRMRSREVAEVLCRNRHLTTAHLERVVEFNPSIAEHAAKLEIASQSVLMMAIENGAGSASEALGNTTLTFDDEVVAATQRVIGTSNMTEALWLARALIGRDDTPSELLGVSLRRYLEQKRPPSPWSRGHSNSLMKKSACHPNADERVRDTVCRFLENQRIARIILVYIERHRPDELLDYLEGFAFSEEEDVRLAAIQHPTCPLEIKSVASML